MVELTLGEIKNLEHSFTKLVEQDLPVRLAYRLGKILKQINNELEHIENLRIALVKKYGTNDEKTNTINVSIDKLEAFLQEWTELLNEKVNLDFEKIKLSELEELEIKITPIDFIKLEYFIDEN
jgi:hypothetical protein